jgi:hypothetical protein
MKKTAIRKIRLSRETLRQLDQEQLTGPLGGAGTLALCNTLTVCNGSCMASCACGGTARCTNTNCSGCC